jgi:hypothetical protein
MEHLLKPVFFKAAGLFCAAVIFIALMAACSRAEPGISFWTMRYVYYEEENGAVTPRLAFFALVNDEDGPEDIAELRLYNDFEGLLWTLKPENWTLHQEEKQTWIGSHTLSMAGSEAFPSGQWRAVIIDKGGDLSERTFGFDTPKTSKHPLPKLTIKDGNWTLESQYPEDHLICYDGTGAYLRTVRLHARAGTIAGLGLPPETHTVSYWGEDTESATAVLTTQASIR